MKKIKSLISQSKTLYPNSKVLRKQWVRKTHFLIDSRKHILYGGPHRWGNGCSNDIISISR